MCTGILSFMQDIPIGREYFPILEDRVFLNWASLSPLSLLSHDAARDLLDMFHTPGKVTQSVQGRMEELKMQASRLFGTETERIAVVGTSTTQAMQVALDAIEPHEGQNIVTGDIEFPSTGAEMQKWRRRGVEIRVLKSRLGAYLPDDVGRLVDSSTSAVVLSSVNWVNGYRNEIERISKIVHEMDSYLVLDAVQHMGAMPLNCDRVGADFICAGSQKFMLNPLGAAIMYAGRRAVEQLHPPSYTISNCSVPEEGWDRYFGNAGRDIFVEYTPLGTAARFEFGGWLNYSGIVSLTETLRLLNHVGSEEIREKIINLSNHLRREMEVKGFQCISPRDREHMSSISTFSLEKEADGLKLTSRLKEKGVEVSFRGSAGMQGLRVALHYFNNESDIDRFVETLCSLT